MRIHRCFANLFAVLGLLIIGCQSITKPKTTSFAPPQPRPGTTTWARVFTSASCVGCKETLEPRVVSQGDNHFQIFGQMLDSASNVKGAFYFKPDPTTGQGPIFKVTYSHNGAKTPTFTGRQYLGVSDSTCIMGLSESGIFIDEGYTRFCVNRIGGEPTTSQMQLTGVYQVPGENPDYSGFIPAGAYNDVSDVDKSTVVAIEKRGRMHGFRLFTIGSDGRILSSSSYALDYHFKRDVKIAPSATKVFAANVSREPDYLPGPHGDIYVQSVAFTDNVAPWSGTYSTGDYLELAGIANENSSFHPVILANRAPSWGHPFNEFVVFQLDKNTGNVMWAKSYKSASTMKIQSFVNQSVYGGYLAAGTVTFGQGAERHQDGLMIWISPEGNVQWTRRYGSEPKTSSEADLRLPSSIPAPRPYLADDQFLNVIPINNGYLATGTSKVAGRKNSDLLVLRLNEVGGCCGGSANDMLPPNEIGITQTNIQTSRLRIASAANVAGSSTAGLRHTMQVFRDPLVLTRGPQLTQTPLGRSR